MPSKPTTLHPGCKINLSLQITALRTDGYHELDTVFHVLDAPSDCIEIREKADDESPTFGLSCSDPALEGPSNLIHTAYHAYAEATGFAPVIHVHLDKHVPTGAGLGGGSADCGAMLVWLHRQAQRAGKALRQDALLVLAARLGADVPVFVRHGLTGERTVRAGGIGDVFSPQQALPPGLWLVLTMPQVHVPTSWAYGAWDEAYAHKCTKSCHEPGADVLTPGKQQAKPPLCLEARAFFNSFESVVFERFRQLAGIKTTFLRAGASTALLSGSGASVFGIFRDEALARRAARMLSDNTTQALAQAL